MLRVFFFAASILAVLFFSAPAMAGETSGLNGFALCTSKAPKEIGYVQGSPVYLSAVFQVYANNAGYEKAYAEFLKQKYNFSGPLNCSVAYTKNDQERTLNQRVQMVGSLAVRTGWVSTNAVAPAVSTTAPAVTGQSAATSGGTYFVCTWPTSADGVLTYYVSDVNGVPAGVNAGSFLGQLAPAFGKFVTAKYNAAGGSYNCVYQFSQADAQALKKRDLTSATPKGYKAVDTGWKYSQTPQ